MITVYCGLTRSGKSKTGIEIYRGNLGSYDIFVTSFIGKRCGINCKNGSFEKGEQLTVDNYKELISSSDKMGIIIDEPEELLSFELIDFLTKLDKDIILLVNKYHDSHFENEYIERILSVADRINYLDIPCGKCSNLATKYIGGNTLYLCDDCFEKEIFIENKEEVIMVEMELHNYCNRNCEWCINSKIKSTDIKYMSDSVFNKAVDEISEYKKYAGAIQIGISRFSEPMYDSKNMMKKTKYIKEKIPNSTLWISTNGDYLDNDTISDLRYIDRVFVMDYDNTGNIGVLNKMELLDSIEIISFDKNKGREVIYALDTVNNTEFVFEVNTAKNRMNSWSFRSMGASLKDPNHIYTNECGNIHSNHKSLSINNKYCTAIGKYIMIDYDGSIMPCPDVSCRFKSHKDELLLGNVCDGFGSIEFDNCISGKSSCINCSFNAEIYTELRRNSNSPYRYAEK